MQATRELNQNAQPCSPLDLRASKLPEYIYRAAILAAVILLLLRSAASHRSSTVPVQATGR